MPVLGEVSSFGNLFQFLMEEKKFTRIGSYWDRKGETEIDLIAVNERGKYAEIIEVKRNSAQFISVG